MPNPSGEAKPSTVEPKLRFSLGFYGVLGFVLFVWGLLRWFSLRFSFGRLRSTGATWPFSPIPRKMQQACSALHRSIPKHRGT